MNKRVCCIYFFVFLLLGLWTFNTFSGNKLITFFSSGKADREWETRVAYFIDKYTGKEIIFPEPAYFSFSDSAVIAVKTAPLKVVAYLDGDCSACLIALSFWKDFLYDLEKHNISLPVLLYVSTFLESTAVQLMNEQWIPDMPWFYDPEANFVHENKLGDKRIRMLLLDGENRVVLIGDPTLNSSLKELYRKKIIELSE